MFFLETVRARIAVFMLNEPLPILVLLNKSENFETVTKVNIFFGAQLVFIAVPLVPLVFIRVLLVFHSNSVVF